MLKERSRRIRVVYPSVLGVFLGLMPGALCAQQAGFVVAVQPIGPAPMAKTLTAQVTPGDWAAAQALPAAVTDDDAADGAAPAQDAPAPQASHSAAAPAPQPHTEQKAQVHRFWDKKNIWLFAGVGAGRALDFTSTRNFRRRGRNEGLLTNAIVDNTPLFATIEIAGTWASIGVSYLFHIHNHHELERWTSYVHIGVSFAGAARNYALPTVHPAPTQ